MDFFFILFISFFLGSSQKFHKTFCLLLRKLFHVTHH
nr:MAG TPA: hypothetical protein [Bacteriophage sp.]